ncbi:polysaccharide deacetylase family protein [Mediterraneibacter glycyrrhizinilyticus]|nr:polysaccharide deacetylase family protein [Mediterraneibacter glycyrrhizinilyticus]HJC90906.1 polysaccharide deacetylase family protein [Candidatus Mediterraneibacter excrementigallinarum]
MRIVVLCILLAVVILLVAGITAAVRAFLKSGDEKDGGKTAAKDITIEDVQEKDSDDDISSGGTQADDARAVKNTATEEHHKTNGLAICMFHYVYDEADPPDDLNNNYIEVHALEEEIEYLVENDYYFPTWEEVRQYVEGDLLLPEKSVVLTFDDGAKSFLDLGIPVFEKYKVPATSFLITSNDGENKVKEYQNDYVTFQSHSDNMHRAGGNIGHGGIFTAMSHDDAVADLEKSIEICGHGDAFAYPYGDYTDECRTAVQDAGFICAVTTENRRAEVGDDPLLLPRVRMSLGQSLDSFIALVE